MRNGGIIDSASYRLLPSDSVDIRDVCGQQMEHGELLGKLLGKRQKMRKMEETRAEWANCCFRRRPRTSADIREVCGRKMEDGGLLGKRQKYALNGRNYGGMGKLLLPTSTVDVREVCGGEMKPGVLLGERHKKCPKWQKVERNGEIIASVSFRHHQWTSAMRVGGVAKLLLPSGVMETYWPKVGKNELRKLGRRKCLGFLFTVNLLRSGAVWKVLRIRWRRACALSRRFYRVGGFGKGDPHASLNPLPPAR